MENEQYAIDFIHWLAKKYRGVIKSQQMPSGTILYGPGLHKVEDWVAEFEASRCQ